MQSDERREALGALLRKLSGPMAMRLARVVEIDRLYGGKLPHDDILAELRPRLRDFGARERLPTPLRYFCEPFEDLLFNGNRQRKQRGRISRSAILPVWNWLGRTLIPNEMESYTLDFRDLAAGNDTLACETLATRFHHAAGEAMQEAFATDSKGIVEYFAAQGSDDFAADAEDMAILLHGSAFAADIRTIFPKPSPMPTLDQMRMFRTTYERARLYRPTIAPFLPVVAMGRLEKPWQALQLVQFVSKQRKDTLIAATDVGLAGEILLARMEEAKTTLISADPQAFDPERLIDALSEFTLLSSAVTKEINILREGKWGQRLLEQRNAISSVMEGYMSRAGKHITAAIPMKRLSDGTAPLLPNFDKAVSAEVAVRAVRSANLVAGCRYLAAAASFVVKYNEVNKDATSMLCFYNNALLEELHSGTYSDRGRVERQFTIAVELSRHILGHEEANLLQKRGEMAQQLWSPPPDAPAMGG